jgi:hypothetical protein
MKLYYAIKINRGAIPTIKFKAEIVFNKEEEA